MSRRNSPERDLHRALVKQLQVRCKPEVVFWHTPNGGSRNVIEARNLKLLGTLAGVPDLTLCRNGETFFLEIKSHEGRLSAEQKALHARLAATGFQVMVGHGLDECLTFLSHSDLLR